MLDVGQPDVDGNQSRFIDTHFSQQGVDALGNVVGLLGDRLEIDAGYLPCQMHGAIGDHDLAHVGIDMEVLDVSYIDLDVGSKKRKER